MLSSGVDVALFAGDVFVALTALGGGIALVTGLEANRFPPEMLRGTPFSSYVILDLILAVVVGGSAASRRRGCHATQPGRRWVRLDAGRCDNDGLKRPVLSGVQGDAVGRLGALLSLIGWSSKSPDAKPGAFGCPMFYLQITVFL